MTGNARKNKWKIRRRKPSQKPLVRLGITLPPALTQRVRAYCDAANLPVSVFLERAARRYLKRLETPENNGVTPTPETVESSTFAGLTVDDERGVIAVY